VRVRAVKLDLVVNGDSCVARAVAAGDARLLRRLLAAGAAADAPAATPRHLVPPSALTVYCADIDTLLIYTDMY
jgi:hypothetical protein